MYAPSCDMISVKSSLSRSLLTLRPSCKGHNGISSQSHVPPQISGSHAKCPDAASRPMSCAHLILKSTIGVEPGEYLAPSWVAFVATPMPHSSSWRCAASRRDRRSRRTAERTAMPQSRRQGGYHQVDRSLQNAD